MPRVSSCVELTLVRTSMLVLVLPFVLNCVCAIHGCADDFVYASTSAWCMLASISSMLFVRVHILVLAFFICTHEESNNLTKKNEAVRVRKMYSKLIFASLGAILRKGARSGGVSSRGYRQSRSLERLARRSHPRGTRLHVRR